MDFSLTKKRLSAFDQESMYLTLATCVSACPENGDAALVFNIAEKTTRMDVKYEIIVALSRLYENSLLLRDDLERALFFTSRFRLEGDEALKKRINLFEDNIFQTSVA